MDDSGTADRQVSIDITGNGEDVQESEHNQPNNNRKDAKIGLAFSGGGIRSASLCSGVLRRLLHRDVEVDCISCVSGGNFTAASYVDWKYHHDNKDDHAWHKDYFEQFRRNVSYICNWQVPWKAVIETVLMILILLLVNLIIPFSVWGSFSIPVAYVVDIAFGDLMRIGFNCKQVNRGSETLTACDGEFHNDLPEVQKPMTLFGFLVITFVVISVVENLVPLRRRFTAFILKVVSGSVLAFVFLPWFIQYFIDVAPWYLNIVFILLSMFFWLGFPLLRTKASLALVFYSYAFITRWRVYKGRLFNIEYTEDTFFYALLAAGFLIWATPFLGMFGNTAVFTFYKWRLQRAFFYGRDEGFFGCQGITCDDFFPVVGRLCPHKGDPDSHEQLTMHDIRDTKPEYISNMTVDYWKGAPDKPPFELMAISPHEAARIDHQPGACGGQDTLSPRHVKVADAMTIAASVVTNKETLDDPFRDLQILLGLAIRKHKKSYYSQDEEQTPLSKVGPILIQSFVALPLVFLAAIYFLGWHSVEVEQICMMVFGVYVLMFTIIACWPEKREWGEKVYRIVRWCHVYLYHVRFLRELLRITKRGADPPALLTLSDAGRLEKYGLMPLLKRRLPKIVVVDGSYIRSEKTYAYNVLRSLRRARETFGCEFVGYEGRDVLGEIEKKYVQHYPVARERHQRSYRFIVRYFQEDPDTPASSGEILILAPRHPNNGVEFPEGLDPTWDQFTADTGLELDEKYWGKSFVLQPKEADRLTFCCCECCHSGWSCIQKASRALCSGFPSHWTPNQFLTSSQFTAYHREGYRACVEAGVEEFLNSDLPDVLPFAS